MTSAASTRADKGEERVGQLKETYARPIRVVHAGQDQAEQVRGAPQGQGEETAQRLGELTEEFLPMVGEVIGGDAVLAKEKPLSLFGAHTQITVRRKPGRPTESGGRVIPDEVGGDIISRCEILEHVG